VAVTAVVLVDKMAIMEQAQQQTLALVAVVLEHLVVRH
jgi:hypothetical protein